MAPCCAANQLRLRNGLAWPKCVAAPNPGSVKGPSAAPRTRSAFPAKGSSRAFFESSGTVESTAHRSLPFMRRRCASEDGPRDGVVVLEREPHDRELVVEEETGQSVHHRPRRHRALLDRVVRCAGGEAASPFEQDL